MIYNNLIDIKKIVCVILQWVNQCLNIILIFKNSLMVFINKIKQEN